MTAAVDIERLRSGALPPPTQPATPTLAERLARVLTRLDDATRALVAAQGPLTVLASIAAEHPDVTTVADLHDAVTPADRRRVDYSADFLAALADNPHTRPILEDR